MTHEAFATARQRVQNYIYSHADNLPEDEVPHPSSLSQLADQPLAGLDFGDLLSDFPVRPGTPGGWWLQRMHWPEPTGNPPREGAQLRGGGHQKASPTEHQPG